MFSRTGLLVTKNRNNLKPATTATLAIANSFLTDPPPNFQSWTGTKRNKEMQPQYAIVSANRIKKELESVNVAEEVEILQETIRKRQKRRQVLVEENTEDN